MAETSASSFLIRLGERLGTLPRWLRAVIGVLLIAAGVLTVLRPFASLTLLVALVAVALLIGGIARLVEAPSRPRPLLAMLAGLVEIVGAVVVVAWPFSVSVLALVVGVVLVASGVTDLAAIWSRGRSRGSRVADGLRGGALLVLGLLTIVWPDVSLIVIAVLFALRLALLGIELVVRALRGPARSSAASLAEHAEQAEQAEHAAHRPGRLLRGLDVAGRAALALLAIVALAGSMLLHSGTPHPTAFYNAPASVPGQPGQLIRSEPYVHAVPEGARGWLILYTTTDLVGAPRVGSAFVMAPAAPAPGPLDVVLWTHGTQGADRNCAPTLLPAPLPLTEPMEALRQQLDQGRVLVGPDYPGMGTAGPQGYLIGEGEGRSSLDAVRAAHQLSDLELSWRTVVWGHSQGGQAALWTGGLAPEYAPEIELLGVSAAAPAADVKGLISTLGQSLIGQVLGPFAVRAYAETYDDVRVTDYVDPRMLPIYEAASRRCLPEKQMIVTLLTALTMQGEMYRVDPATGPLGDRLDENVPTKPIAAPLFIAQGGDDPLILPSVQEAYVQARCAAGQAMIYREYPGRDHLGVVADDSPYSAELMAWTDDRFAGRAQTENSCD